MMNCAGFRVDVDFSERPFKVKNAVATPAEVVDILAGIRARKA